MSGPPKGNDVERFWSKVDKRRPDECWPWNGTMSNNGYGVIGVGSARDGTFRNVTAHRYVCEIAHGLAATQQALHRCDNKRCVNPLHIYAGTHLDNMRDAKERGLMVGGSLPGARNPKAKIAEADVIAIRQSCERNVRLAERYGLSKTQIGWIKSGRSWSHVRVD